MSALILKLDIGGQPMEWIKWEDAATHYAKEQVAWTLGEKPHRFFGGVNRLRNIRSYMDIHPVIAVRGQMKHSKFTAVPPLNNRELFSRDRHTCLYCLSESSDKKLTRDHVIPVSRQGKNVWTNVVTACRKCNQRKGARTPAEANMTLHAVPYTPNYAEWLILKNRKILTDQMSFLQALCPERAQRWK